MQCKILAFILACTSVSASAQLEVSWAYTLEGAAKPWVDYWHDAGTIAVDPWGNVAVASYGGAQVVMNTAGAPLVVPHNTPGAGDGYVGRYRSDGSPSWGFWLGSAEFDAPTGVEMDNEGNVYLSFFFEGSFDMDPGPDSAMIAPADGDRDLVIIKYDSAGHYLHGIHLVAEYHNPRAVVIERMGFDADNNLYIAGFFRGSMDVDPDTTNEVLLIGNGNNDCGFVAKYDPDGHLLQHLVLRSTDYVSDVMDLVVDPDGSIFVVGIFSDSLDLDTGPAYLFIEGPNIAAFAARFDAAFQLEWGRSLAATGLDHYAYAACRGLDGGLIFNGIFRGDITVTLNDGTVLNMYGGFNEPSTYLAALDADGQFIWFKQFEVGQRGDFFALAAKDDGTFYGAMSHYGTFNMDPGGSNYTVSNSGFPNYDMALARYTMAEGDLVLGHAFPSGGSNYNHVELLGSAMYMSGTYSGSLHPDIPQTANVLTPGGLALIKYCHLPENITYSVLGDTLFACPGADTLILATGAEQFLWYDSLVGGLRIGNGDTLLLPGLDRSFTVFVEGVNGTCVSQRVPIHLVLRPHVELSVDSLTICQGDTVVLGYTGTADLFTPNLPEAFDPNGFVPFSDISISVLATDLTAGCTAADTGFIHVLPLPDVSLNLAPDSVCLFGSSVTLGGGSPAGGTWIGEGVVNDTLWSPLESGPGAFPVTYTVVDSSGCAASAVDMMEVEVCFTGIADQPMDGISIGPNPFTEVLMLRSNTDVRYVLYNAMGAELLSGTARAGTLTRLDADHLAVGVYTLRVAPKHGAGGRVYSVMKSE